MMHGTTNKIKDYLVIEIKLAASVFSVAFCIFHCGGTAVWCICGSVRTADED